MRLLGRVMYAGQAACGDCRQHGVDRRAHAGHVQEDVAAPHLVGSGDQHAAQGLHLRAQGAHALDGLVDGARADVAAARQRNLRPVEQPQQHRSQIIGSAHLARQLVGRVVFVHGAGIHPEGVVSEIHARAQPLEHLDDDMNVVDIRDIFDRRGGIRQQRRRDDGHRSVLAAADRDLALQAFVAVNSQLFLHILIHPAQAGPFHRSCAGQICKGQSLHIYAYKASAMHAGREKTTPIIPSFRLSL